MLRKILVTIAVGAWLVAGALSAVSAADKNVARPVPADTVQPDTGTVSPAVGEDAPLIFFPETGYDFGKSPQQTSLTHVFKVENKGNAPLIIESVKAS